jgi:hypothetical protein
MNAVGHALLVRATLTSRPGIVAISAIGSALKRTRPTMTWHIDSTNGRPVAHWIMLPAQSSIASAER